MGSSFVEGISGSWLLARPANALANQFGKSALRILAELIVMRSLLADDEAPAVVACVEPFRGRGGDAAGAVEAHSRPHLDERSALRKFRGFFVLDANQRHPLIALEHPHRADGNFVAGFGLSDTAPLSRCQQQTHHKYRRQHDRGEYDESFFQSCCLGSASSRNLPKREIAAVTLLQKRRSVNV